ncbi:histidine kinase [Streptomyces sp. NPDC048275]|uniref:sensor histidine kinase n=1 Tax=Streptomyces sp. NPDC048275 TaxID=3155629 RepID=UPI0033EC3DC6
MKDPETAPEPARRTSRTRILVEGTGRRKIVRSAALWVALAVPALLDSPGDADSPPLWWRLAGVLLLVPVVGFRDTRLPLSWCAGAVLSLISPWFAPSVFVMSYLAGRRGDVRERPVEVAVAVSVVLTALGVIGTTAGHVTTWVNSAPLLVGAVTAWLAGRHRHQRRELELAGWQRARDLEREHQLAADRARIRERARIAQDMHDQLGHDLTLIAMQAAALEVAPQLDESARSTAGELRRSTALAIGRLSDIIGVLRVDSAQESTSPREDLVTTVDRARSAGMLVDLRRIGLDITAPAVVEEAVQRVVQESLTNAAKHAPGAEVLVRIDRLTDHTVVTVTNGVHDRPAREAIGNSMGLVGLSERVRVLGGTLSAGHRDGGGFEVSARLPHSGVRYGSGDADQPPVPGAPLTVTAQRDAEQRVRRSLAAVLAVPVVAVAVVCVMLVVYFSNAVDSATLDATTYRNLAEGQRWEDLRTVLPTQQAYVDRDTDSLPSPAHAVCRYYRAEGGGLFSMEAKSYRLCFIDGKLVSKDEVDENTR